MERYTSEIEFTHFEGYKVKLVVVHPSHTVLLNQISELVEAAKAFEKPEDTHSPPVCPHHKVLMRPSKKEHCDFFCPAKEEDDKGNTIYCNYEV